MITGIVYVAYATLLCGGPKGQTVGMMAVGVRVSCAADGTHDVLGVRASIRAGHCSEQVLRVIGVVTIILGLVWLLDMLFPLCGTARRTRRCTTRSSKRS